MRTHTEHVPQDVTSFRSVPFKTPSTHLRGPLPVALTTTSCLITSVLLSLISHAGTFTITDKHKSRILPGCPDIKISYVWLLTFLFNCSKGMFLKLKHRSYSRNEMEIDYLQKMSLIKHHTISYNWLHDLPPSNQQPVDRTMSPTIYFFSNNLWCTAQNLRKDVILMHFCERFVHVISKYIINSTSEMVFLFRWRHQITFQNLINFQQITSSHTMRFFCLFFK